MAITYRLRQDNRQVTKYPGKWFAHSVNLNFTADKEMEFDGVRYEALPYNPK